MKKTILIFLFMAFAVYGAGSNSFVLGRQLLTENSAELAAIEFRRYAMETENAGEQAFAYLHAAYAYMQAEAFDDAKQMAQKSEKLNPDETALPLLYAEIAARQGDTQTALYFLDIIPPQTETNRPMEIYTARRSAEMLLRAGKADEAGDRLIHSPVSETNAIHALNTYIATPRKSPVVGGLLGLFPGAGYWYSGEIANGTRSFLLNSLFMFAMYHTASHDQWGAFAAVSFFEITWYTGSIYGGIDAAHRYNKDEVESCIDRFNVPDLTIEKDITIPLFQLKVVF
jgi:tetratricopeptide (TPR) repeat protein